MPTVIQRGICNFDRSPIGKEFASCKFQSSWIYRQSRDNSEKELMEVIDDDSSRGVAESEASRLVHNSRH